MRYTLVIAMLCVLVTGCEKSPSDEMKSKVEDAKDKAKETTHNVFSGMVNTIDKAKGVSKTVMDSAAEQRRKIDEESQ